MSKEFFVDRTKAKSLIKEGFYAIDPHCHTCYSYDVPEVPQTTPKNLITQQLKQGLKGYISDHDTINGYNNGVSIFGKKKIISGAEITLKPKIMKKVDQKNMHTLHINVFNIKKADFEILSDIARIKGNLDEFTKYARDNDIEYMYNHPFWKETGEKLQWRAVPGIAKNYFDVLELNAGQAKTFNDLTLHVANKLNKGLIASSDSHTAEPGTAFTLAEGKNFRTFWDNVKNRKMLIVRRDMTPFALVHETSQMMKNIFEANVNPIPERKYTPASGISVLDNISRAVTSGNLKNQFILKKIMQTAFLSINYSAGPIIGWKFYLSKENNTALQIKEHVEKIVHQLDIQTIKSIKSIKSLRERYTNQSSQSNRS